MLYGVVHSVCVCVRGVKESGRNQWKTKRCWKTSVPSISLSRWETCYHDFFESSFPNKHCHHTGSPLLRDLAPWCGEKWMIQRTVALSHFLWDSPLPFKEGTVTRPGLPTERLGANENRKIVHKHVALSQFLQGRHCHHTKPPYWQTWCHDVAKKQKIIHRDVVFSQFVWDSPFPSRKTLSRHQTSLLRDLVPWPH